MRTVERGSNVHNEQTVAIVMSGGIAHAQNSRISTSALKSDVTIIFLNTDFFYNAKILAICIHLRQI